MSRPRKTPETLRSFRWFGTSDLRSFGHRSRTLQMGFSHEEFMGKPVIGVVNTWSEVNPCHTHLRDRAEAVKRAVWAAGGFPVEIPVMSVSEQYQKPTTMFYRNFLAMETEESIRSHPLDGVVLLGGCDKSTPALIMGACSAGLPFIFVPAGPMLRGNWAGKVLGSGADVWKYWAEKQAGNITEAQWHDMESGIARSYGTCMVMGTAATMMSHAEVLGLTLPGASAIPAADGYTGERGIPYASWGIGVAENSAHKDAAFKLVSFLMSKDTNSKLSTLAKAFPGNTQSTPDFSGSDELFKQAFDIYKAGYPANEFTGLPTAEDLMRQLGQQLQTALDGQQSMDDALKNAQTSWEAAF